MQQAQVEGSLIPITADLKSPKAFLSQLEVLRDLIAAAGSRHNNLEGLLSSITDATTKELLKEFVAACEKIDRLLPDAERILISQISSDQFRNIQLPEIKRFQGLATKDREAQAIDLDRVLIIPKISKLEYYRRQHSLTHEQAKQSLSIEQGDISMLEKADSELQETISKFHKFFRSQQIVDQDQIDPQQLKQASLVIAVGGDDHLCFVAQQVKGEVPILGVKADAQSVGALLDHDVENLDSLVLNLAEANYRFEPWQRLKVSVDGQEIPATLSTIFVGDGNSQRTSRIRIQIEDSDGKRLYGTEGQGLEQRSSGALIYTGTGSTGWASSASLYLYPQGKTFSRSSRYVSYVVREPTLPSLAKANSIARQSENQISFPKLTHFNLYEGQKLIINSLNKEGGIINADSICVPFSRGSKAVIEIDPEPLWVIVPKEKSSDMSEHKVNLSLLESIIQDPRLGLVSRNQRDSSYPVRQVTDDNFRWSNPDDNYQPAEFNHPKLLTAAWAESADISKEEFQQRLNSNVLKSFEGKVKLCPQTGRPLNPTGRTGISGRGVLGKWGSNFAVDPIVISKDLRTGEYSLLVIERKDGGWALPGGMVDPGESVTDALFRELEEETKVTRAELESYLIKDWGIDIYSDDRRSTDNAWIETSARLLLIPEELRRRLDIKAGSDADKVKWLKLDNSLPEKLYGSHAYMVLQALKSIENKLN
jgi:ADP-ribose pyrophosphatase